MVLVRKKDGTLRVCVDFRRVNAITRKDASPLPRIQEVLDALQGSSYFSSLDFQQGFHQVRLHPDSMEITAFSTPDNESFEYVRMPFGVANAPSAFSRLMDILLTGVPTTVAMAYIDDLIVHGASFEAAFEHLERILKLLIKHQVKMKPSKCALMRREITYLGFVVSKDGVRVDPAKVSAILALLPPADKKTLQQFLGMVGFFRRFIFDYAKVASPLTKLTGTV
jgi:hypothetical protein